METTEQVKFGYEYLSKLDSIFTDSIMLKITKLANSLCNTWASGNRVFICGNGGSAANALHIANDLHFGVTYNASHANRKGFDVEALSSNTSVITCIANDTGYENIFASQIVNKGSAHDVLIVLSGSGNSVNVVNALKVSHEKGMESWAIVGFDGGECKRLSDEVIHLEINDMQISEDAQLIIGHICMKLVSMIAAQKEGKNAE